MVLQSPPSRHSLRRKGSRKSAEEEKPTGSGTDIPLTVTRESVMALIDNLQSDNSEDIKRAVIELRLLSKCGPENRVLIGEAGGIPFLISLITSPDSEVQENAVTALLNLSILPANRTAIMDTRGILDSITRVLRTGQISESKENCAALLSSLLIVEENRHRIGKDFALLNGLRDLLSTGRVQGKKDAIRAIFHLALWPDNKNRLANAGILPIFKAILASPQSGLIEDTLSVSAKIAMCRDGMEELSDRRTISLIVDYLQHGSRLARENATSLLLALCQTGGSAVAAEVRKHQESVISSLCTLRAVGSSRAKAKASDLMKVLMVSGSFSLAMSE